MYDAAPLFLNPSMTGVFEGDWRIHTHYRTQWKAVNFKPYTTALISFDMPYKKWGFGGQIMNYRAGIGNYNALQGLVSAGYSTPIDGNKAHNIAFGIQGGITQKSVEYQLHSFNNQYVTTNGCGFDNSLASGESFGGQSFIVPDVNAGLMYYYARQQSRVNPFVGLSAFNLLTPAESWYGVDNRLPMRFYLHTGARVNITETIFVLPKVLVMQQENFSELTLAADVGFFLKDAELYLLGGLVYRAKDAMVVSIGARKSHFIAKVGYDINTSSLAPSTTGRGAFEISFTYMKQKPKPKEAKICPRL
jgi:type IX secretion system PorP/SprF family membrane protein